MNFWDVHSTLSGIFFLIMLACIPRITLGFLALLMGAIGINFLGVVGWIFCPRIVVAVIATNLYLDTNPVLCTFAWIVAIIGDFGEKAKVYREMYD